MEKTVIRKRNDYGSEKKKHNRFFLLRQYEIYDKNKKNKKEKKAAI